MAVDSTEVDLYGKQYGSFATQLYEQIRETTYGEQIGQNGWLTASEHDLFIGWLGAEGKGDRFRVLDVACGSGGPTLRIAERAGCSVDGVDIHDQAEHQSALEDIEGESDFLGQQTFFEVTARLARERRLSRIAYAAHRS